MDDLSVHNAVNITKELALANQRQFQNYRPVAHLSPINE
jgi:hypothetical protein